MTTIEDIMTDIEDRVNAARGGVGVDSGIIYIGTAAGLEQASDRIHSFNLNPLIEGEGMAFHPGIGDGYYPVLRGQGNPIDEQAEVTVLCIRPVERIEHTDIDGTISWPEQVYDLGDVEIARSTIIELGENQRLLVVGDPSGNSADVGEADLDPGRYEIRELRTKLEDWGMRTVAVTVRRV